MKCKICKSDKIRKIFAKHRYDFYKCLSCSVIFQDPVIMSKIEEYYRNKYFNEHERPFNQFVNWLSRDKYLKIVRLIKKFKKNGTLLDIGAGYGFFIKTAEENGFNVIGIEPNINSAKIAKEKLGVILDNRFFDLNYKEKSKFDIITGFHIIEHLLNPVAFIDSINNRLNRGGLLILETPNADSFNAKRMKENWPFVLPNEHLYLFSKVSLLNLLRRKNFRIVRTQSTGPWLHSKSKTMIKSIRRDKPPFLLKFLNSTYTLISEKAGLGDHMLVIAKKN